MHRLRTLSRRRLTALVAALTALAVTAATATAGLLAAEPRPEPKPLDRAILEAVNAPAPAGVSARVTFTNRLIPSGALPPGGAGPILSGAEGRVWVAGDGRLRLELQSERGDAQIVSDGRRLQIYDPAAKTVYRVAAPPREEGGRPDRERVRLADVRRGLERLTEAWTLSGARPTSTGGRPTYTVRIAPKDDGGLLGAARLAWDAAKGVPLRAAIYAQGQSEPVLELKATDVSYGPIDDRDLRVQAPADARVVTVDPPAGAAKAGHRADDVSGVDAVQRRLDFDLAAPAELAGAPRREIRLVRFGGEAGALSVYGEGLGGMIVLQRKARAPRPAAERDALPLPQINIDGATGTELATALGTVLQFRRDGVEYTVLGSVPPVAAENAARGLR